MVDKTRPLAGYKVIDFSAVYAGPICTRMLQDYGAEVIKVEPPGMGDLTRGVAGMSPVFAHFNAGKKSVAIDLKQARGRELARELIRGADIVVENFRPGIMQRFGLDYHSLSAQQPALVYCSISGFGQSGPWVNRAAFAPIVHAASGFDTVFARAQGDKADIARSGDSRLSADATPRPPNWEIMVADILTGAYAFGAIQTALLGRINSGRGEHIDVSMMDAMMTLIPAQLQAAQNTTKVPIGCFYPIHTRDGYIMVTGITDKNLQSLSEVLKRPDLLQDPRFVFGPRTDNHHWLALEIEKWSANLTTAECEEMLNGAGIPCATYPELEDLFSHPQVVERGSFRTVNNDVLGEFLIQNMPVKFSQTENQTASWVANLGEHSAEVLHGELGLPLQEIERLRAQNIIC